MSYHITTKDINDINFEQNYNNHIILPKNLGRFNIKDSKITDDIFLFKMDHHFNDKIEFDYDVKNIFHINIIIEGDYELKGTDKNLVKGTKGNTITSFINQDKGLHKKRDNSFKSIGIVVKGDFLNKHLFSKLEDTKNIKKYAFNTLKNETTNIKTQICANELFYMQENNTLSDIYKESRVLDILYNEFNDILNNQKKPVVNNIKLDEYDLQALKKAKEILINNIQNPPSIKELSKLVCLNEFKLKKGFKEKYHITPYKLVEQSRMEKAKYLLENKDMNINEIAEFLGYKYQSNFSLVFKQYFKVSPKEIMKSRKYY